MPSLRLSFNLSTHVIVSAIRRGIRPGQFNAGPSQANRNMQGTNGQQQQQQQISTVPDEQLLKGTRELYGRIAQMQRSVSIVSFPDDISFWPESYSTCSMRPSIAPIRRVSTPHADFFRPLYSFQGLGPEEMEKAKAMLIGWKKQLESATQECSRRGIDSAAILRGAASGTGKGAASEVGGGAGGSK